MSRITGTLCFACRRKAVRCAANICLLEGNMASVLVVNSSFRKNSNSTELGKQVAQGAQNAGHDVVSIDISRKQIGPCRGCDACLQPGASGCVNKDDMQEFYPLIRKADTIIFVSPIYWFNMGGQIKQFIDRCYSVAVSPGHQGPSPFAVKKLGAVFVYGGEDPFDSGCVNAIRTLQDICHYTGAAWAGAMYGSAYGPGEAGQNAALMKKALDYGAGV